MPSPIDVLADPITLATLGLFALLLAWELVRPARRLPEVPFWWARGLLGFVCYFALATYLPFLWAEHLEALRLVDLGGLGTLGGAIVGVLAYELALYAWHRAMHSSDVLWRVFHQLHHSAERLDAVGAFWSSPLESAAWVVLFSLVMSVLGLAPGAVVAVSLVTTFFSIFQHANVRTPRWLGVLVQRPEAHSLHHGRGRHRGNYADLPIIDLLFGTYESPADFAPETGFYDGASDRVWEMLTFRDVSSPREGSSDGAPDSAGA